MHIPLPPIPNNNLIILPTLILLNINPQSPINLQFQTNLIINQPSSRIIASIYTLQFQFLQSSLKIRELGG